MVDNADEMFFTRCGSRVTLGQQMLALGRTQDSRTEILLLSSYLSIFLSDNSDEGRDFNFLIEIYVCIPYAFILKKMLYRYSISIVTISAETTEWLDGEWY